MATLDQLSAALVKADAAGNTDDARVFAAEIRKMRAKPAVEAPKPEKSINQSFLEGARDLTAGAVRGAGSIGATLVAPYDMAKDAIAGKGLSLESNRERRKGMDDALQTMGADTDSIAFKGGKLAGEIAGTAGAGGVLAKPVQALAGSRLASGAEPILNGLATSLKTGGFRTGEMAGAGAGNALTRIIGGAATGGASAGLVDPSTAGVGAVIGGALPGATQLAGQAGAGLRGLMAGKVAPEVATLAKRAKELGINIPADRLLNSKPLDAVASGLRYTPFSGRAASETAMEGQLDRAVSRTFGQNSENVTQALRKAGDDLGGKFETTLTQNGVSFDKKLLDDVSTVYNKAEAELGSDALKPIKSAIDTLVSKGESGVIEGQAAYNIKKDLDRIGRGSGNEAHHALELKGVLMDALNRSLGPEKAAAFATTRQQYGNMLALEKLARNGAEGGISAARLSNMKNINNPELQELADIAAQFVKQRESSHGGAQRAAAGAIATYLGGPTVAAAGAMAGRGANMALNSNKLRDLLLNQASPLAEQNSLGLLTQGAYRSAPLLPAQ